MDEPRYYVRHSDGWSTSWSDPFTSYPATSYIRDRWYCCRDVLRFTVRQYTGGSRDRGLEQMRAATERECARLNAEHDAALARDGMVSC